MAAARSNPHGLEARGLRLFKSISEGVKLSEPEIVNLVEACRLADRLEKLNALITGDADAWSYVKLPRGDGDPVEVIINDPMKEARQHAAALRSALAPFEVAKPEQSVGEVPSNVASIKDKLTAPAGRTSSRSKRPAV
ncbi:hypothetical protein [Microbacterium sp. SORGH_AS_0862]|uniref:hypothetical protein n=1 Tax=Microbacterium sp. SORGH_AS_0862 TaxID=3041789 RepID=UPI002792DE68|nr:hypothetical protein [Microbacterium sp. SORGH_AS_0862]MDQ1205045.1 hypothetical protein [Microbacterium sp. SORGH_AS_0862]